SRPEGSGAAEDRAAAAAVELQLHAGLRHGVPVDREARAADVGGAREPEAAPARELAAALFPAGGRDDFVDAWPETHRAHAQEVRGQRVRGLEMALPHSRRIEAEAAGVLVELSFPP